MRTILRLVLAVLAAAALAGCRSKPEAKDYELPLPPGELALRKITDPQQVPDLTRACADATGLRESVELSLNYLSKPSSRKSFPYGSITHEQAVASLKTFAELLGAGLSPERLNAAIREKFDVYVSVGCDGRGTVLFTCYYTPVFDGSWVRTEKFRYPLYRPPKDLEKKEDGSPATPMPDRKTIEEKNLYAGNELVWLSDPFEAYVAHIEGSVRLRLPDGKEVTVGYAASNGHEYRSVRAELVKDRRVGPRGGLGDMIGYFRAHPGELQGYTRRNPRFVFFAEVADGRPRGSLNEPVTPRRTIATDKKVFPPGCLAFLATDLPQRVGATVMDLPYTGFALDQDTGGAIRAAGRCDVYLGVGADAGELAGRAQNEGKLYYLFLKPEKMAPVIAPPTSTSESR